MGKYCDSGYGMNNTQGVGNRKTQDVINLSTNYGRKLGETNWYVSGGAGLISQFAAGYDDGNNPDAAKIPAASPTPSTVPCPSRIASRA